VLKWSLQELVGRLQDLHHVTSEMHIAGVVPAPGLLREQRRDARAHRLHRGGGGIGHGRLVILPEQQPGVSAAAGRSGQASDMVLAAPDS